MTGLATWPSHRWLLWLLVLLWSAGCSTAERNRDDSVGPAVVVLVRHAEREDQLRPDDSPSGPDGTLRGAPDDPALSRLGQERSGLIAELLADAQLDDVWSTDYLRTHETALPTADAAGLAINAYDPGDLPGFAERLIEMGGRHLVVGHSNTTPELVTALGGDPGSPIEESEYDRLYIVSVVPGSTTTTVLLRFGAPHVR